MNRIITIITDIIVFTAILVGMVVAIRFACFAQEIDEEFTRYRPIIMSMSEEEIVEIQQVLCLEAGTDTWEGRVATAQVMLNRVLSDKFPNTVHEVLSQRNPTQYSTYRRRHKAQYGERECDAIEFLCDCTEEELYLDYDRLYQDCKPIGKKPIKVGRQYFGY